MNKEILEVSEQLMTAAANAAYQGILLTALVAVCLRCCRRANAATRHAVWFGTLLLVAALIPAHLVLNRVWPAKYEPNERPLVVSLGVQPKEIPLPMNWNSHSTSPQPHSSSAFAQKLRRDKEERGTSPAAFGNFGVLNAGTVRGNLTPALLPKGEGKTFRAIGRFMVPDQAGIETGASHESRPPGQTGLLRGFADRFAQPRAWAVGSGAAFVRSAGPWLLAAWLIGAGWRTSLLVHRLGQIRRLKRNARPAIGSVEQRFRALTATLGVTRPVVLKLSREQSSPSLLGFVHPVVILPESAEHADLVETEPILKHELAHVKRRDDWANLAQHLVEAAICFHPAVPWISRRLSLEREIACDDVVLQQGGRPRDYALVLANFAGRVRDAAPLLAPGVSTNKSQLKQRIAMILNTHRNTSPGLAKSRLGFIASAAVATALVALVAGPRLVLAQSQATATPGIQPIQTAPDVASPAGLAGVALPPRAEPQSELALSDTANQPIDNVAPGPKAKAESDDDVAPPAPSPRIKIARPAISVGVAPVAPDSPQAPDAPSASALPRHAKAMADSKDSASLERRLERVERMLESLRAEQHGNKPDKGYAFNWSGPGYAWSSTDSEKLKQSIEREVAAAAEQAKRAVEEGKRAAEQLQHEFKAQIDANNFNRPAEAMSKEAFQSQLEAVRRARESLQREVERLDRQIERLQREHERMDSKSGDSKAQSTNRNADSHAAETALNGN